ncbi:hypothetical protein SAMN04488105_102283 [Salipiger thiooxidans]|uniref:Uncharacterized protein n=1 Tax=Salipiger thiooxidans TaxID=282683 RepID=A0A1G7BN24_9RHOB|nr:hypothetical protein [Salipiger thiooxidans]SDE28518.1 hypothetical protein SAMN04488105_102283 [Salipiger thiooxidans]
MIEKSYLVTRDKDLDDLHFVHTEDCQVLPDRARLDRLGAFERCAPAMDAARERFRAVEACALCCPRCRNVAQSEAA